MSKVKKISLISDVHVLPSDLIADNRKYQRALSADRKLMTESQGLLLEAMKLIEDQGSDVLFVSGDLTKDGEVLGHEYFRSVMDDYVNKKEGRRVFLIPGNHDINNPTKSYDFNGGGTGQTVPTPSISPQGFMEVYKDLVFDQALDLYKDSDHFKSYLEKVNSKYEREEKYREYAHGYTSYASRIDLDDETPGANGLTVIGVDTVKYSIEMVIEEKDGLQNTEGNITPEMFMWLADVTKEARERKDVIMLLAHQAFVPHFYNQENTLAAYIIDDWDKEFEISYGGLLGKIPIEALADMGINFMFTGHMHGQDISKYTSPAGNRIYDIETGSIVTYPLPIRHMELVNLIKDYGQVELDVKTQQISSFEYIDLDKKVKRMDDAISHATSYLITPELIRGLFANYVLPHLKVGSKHLIQKYYKAEDDNYGKAILNKLERKLGSDFDDATHKKVSIVDIFAYVQDLDNAHLYGEGSDIIIDLKFLGMKYGYAFPEQNLNLFIEDVLRQVDEKIVSEEKFLIDTVYELASEFLSFKIADEGRIQTLSDLVNEAYLTYLAGDEVQDQDLKKILEKYRHENMLKAAIGQLSTRVAEKLDYIARNIVYSPSVSNYIYRYTDNNRLIAKLVDKKFYETFGIALIDTLLSFNLTSKKVINKVMELERVDAILNPLNNLIMDMTSNLTSEYRPEYEMYAYEDDNNTRFVEKVWY